MYMIAHPAVRVDTMIVALQLLRQYGFPAESVISIKKYITAPIATQDHMIQATGHVNSRSSRHSISTNSILKPETLASIAIYVHCRFNGDRLDKRKGAGGNLLTY
jgi:hypothetical protein